MPLSMWPPPAAPTFTYHVTFPIFVVFVASSAVVSPLRPSGRGARLTPAPRGSIAAAGRLDPAPAGATLPAIPSPIYSARRGFGLID